MAEKRPANEILKEIVSIVKPTGQLEKIRRALTGGKNTVLHNAVSETISLDFKWIDEIESGLFHIEKISKEPKSFIKDEEYIVDVGKARKINSRTVRHLAANTKNIESVEDGEIRPKRVLTIENEEDFGIYENRFIVALIERLQIFVERRFRDITEKMSRYNVTNLKMDSEFELKNSKIEYNLSLVLKEPPKETKQAKENIESIKRIENIRKRLRILTNTSFYRTISLLKPVHPPISKTNIIKMNTDYSTAYKLWLYVSAYTFVGYSVVTQDKKLPVDGEYYDDLTMIAGLSVKALLDNDSERKEEYALVEARPPRKKKYKVLTQIKLKPSFRQDRSKVGDDTVNEFYYNQIKAALQEAVDMPKNYNLVEQKELDMSFMKFVRALEKINFEMFTEIIRTHSKAIAEKQNKGLKGRMFQIKQQEKIYGRYLMLSKLKSAELEKALRAESREFMKLEKMKANLEFEAEKNRIKMESLEEIKRDEEQTEAAGPDVVDIRRRIDAAKKAAALERKEKSKIKKAKAKTETKKEAVKKKSKAALEKKVALSREKAADIKDDLLTRERKRLMEIAEQNKRRKERLLSRRTQRQLKKAKEETVH